MLHQTQSKIKKWQYFNTCEKSINSKVARDKNMKFFPVTILTNYKKIMGEIFFGQKFLKKILFYSRYF